MCYRGIWCPRNHRTGGYQHGSARCARAHAKSGGLHVSRRTVTRGMAWSVPAVAVATAAPAWANHSVPIIITPTGGGLQAPWSEGQNLKSYHFTFCFNNTSAFDAVVTSTSMIVNGVPNPLPLIPTAVWSRGRERVHVRRRPGLRRQRQRHGDAEVSYSDPGAFFEDEIVVPFAGDHGVCRSAATRADGRRTSAIGPPPHEPVAARADRPAGRSRSDRRAARSRTRPDGSGPGSRCSLRTARGVGAGKQGRSRPRAS